MRNDIINVLLEGFRGWVSPSGDQLISGEGEDHGSHADRILNKQYPSWDWSRSKRFTRGGVSYASDALEYRGWIRVVDDGIYTTYKLTPDTIYQLEQLIAEIDDDTPVMIGLVKGPGLRQTSKEKALEWLNSINEDEIGGDEDQEDDFKEVYGEPGEKKYLPLGSVSSATMREEDLIPRFLYVLKYVDPERAAQLEAEYDEMEDKSDPEFCWETVMNELDQHTLPYTYFGSNPGDGSDYGVWVSTESLDDDLKYDNPEQLRAIKKGEPVIPGSGYVVVVDGAGEYQQLLDGRTGRVIWSIE